MLKAMACNCASSNGAPTVALRRENSARESCGRSLSYKLSLRKQACEPLKLLNETGRTCSLEAFQRNSFNQPILFRFHSLQGNGSCAFSQSEDIGLAEMEKVQYSTKTRHVNGLLQLVPFIGRALLTLVVGLGLSMPALARTAPPPVSTVSAGDNMMQKDEITAKKHVTDPINQNRENVVSGEQEDLGNSSFSSSHDASNNLNASEISDDQLRFSVNFWKGIPAPEGSYLYKLKMQLHTYPRDTVALEALLQAVMEQRDMLRALTVLETLLDVQPNELRWKLLKARTHEFLGELSMAEMEYEALLSLEPLSARYVQGLAMLYKRMGGETEALQLVQRALDRACSEKKDMEARNLGVLLSQFYIQLGNFERALQHLRTMIEQDPDDFRPYLCQGLAYVLMDQKDKAKENFKKYTELCPPDAFDHAYLDSLLLKAQSAKRTDGFMKESMKATSRNSKKAKPMKQPSFGEKINPGEDDFLE